MQYDRTIRLSQKELDDTVEMMLPCFRGLNPNPVEKSPISREEAEDIVRRIRPALRFSRDTRDNLVRDHWGNELRHVRALNPDCFAQLATIPMLLDESVPVPGQDILKKTGDLAVLCDVTMYHRDDALKMYRPTLAEIALQVPAFCRGCVCVFEPQLWRRWNEYYYPPGCRKPYVVMETRLYGERVLIDEKKDLFSMRSKRKL